jgi:hypothetical protein
MQANPRFVLVGGVSINHLDSVRAAAERGAGWSRVA